MSRYLGLRDCLVRAKATTIALTVTQLLALREARRNWERRMGALLLGGRPDARTNPPRRPEPGKAVPGGEIYLSFPGLGNRLGARLAGEIGDHSEQFDTPNTPQCYAGTAPVTRRSGGSELMVARRLAHNRYLGGAAHQWAFCSLTKSTWARQFYDTKIAQGKSHHATLRALANRWLELLRHCLNRGVTYDENIHTHNRKHALHTKPAARG